MAERYYDSKPQREATWVIALTFLVGCMLGAAITVGYLA